MIAGRRTSPTLFLLLLGALALTTGLRPGRAQGGSTPYGGTPVTLPGTIEAERFDEGGSGVAFSDTTAGNSGGQFRATDVDIQRALDATGSFNVGWMKPGEWMKYSVSVAAAGSYTLQFRVAASTAGARLHLEVDGVDKTGPIVLPATGGTQSWSTLSIGPVTLGAGPQVWRLAVDGANPNGGVGNINFIKVVSSSSTAGSTPFGGTSAALPGTVQAENFDEGGRGIAYVDTTAGNSGGQYRTTDVDVERAVDVGTGYLVGWMKPGEWLAYTVNVAASSSYTLDVRLAASTAGARFHLEANGVDVTGPMTFPATGGTQAWSTISKTGVALAAGVQVLRLVIDSANPNGGVGNVNWMRIAPAGAAVRGPYLQQVTANSAVVVWTTRQAGAAAVRYGGPGGGSATAPAETRLYPASQTGLSYDAYQHEARISGLAAATRYSYDLLLSGVDTTPGQEAFTTAPAAGTGTVRFIAFGDSGVGSAAQFQLADRMAADTFDLALHGGDVVYGTSSGVGSAGYRQYENWFFAVYDSWLRSRPVFPSIGNHDDEVAFAQAYRDVFALPENGASSLYPDHAERFYSFDYGPVHFVALDTERAFRDPARRAEQVAWLDADLAATSQPWKIVYFHRPPYNAGTRHGSDLAVRQAFGPPFERHGVQLVLTAHEHTYERSIPLREFEPTGERVVYLVSGGGGAPLYPAGKAAWTAMSLSAHHYVKVTVAGCTLTGQATGTTGTALDTFTIDRCAAAARPTATPNPAGNSGR